MSIRRNTLFNFAGSALPMGVALITVPLYLQKIGQVRYGVLAIVWLFLGYFSLFDLGLGTATTNQIAKLRNRQDSEREIVFWSAFTANSILGLFASMIFWVAGYYFYGKIFAIPDNFLKEVFAALPWLALSIPVMTMSSVAFGAIAAGEHFFVLNILRVIGTFMFQVSTLVVAYCHGPDLQWLIATAVLSKISIGIFSFEMARRLLPLKLMPRCKLHWIKSLYSFGAWVTVSNIISPIIVSLDRFLIGTVSGAAALTYYTVPYNLARRFQMLPGSLSSALFPRLSMYRLDDARNLASRSILSLAIAITPMIIIGIIAMQPFLSVWIDKDFALKGTRVGEAILTGAWINSLAFIPFGMLQAQGKPNVVATFHLLELIPFAFIIFAALKFAGIQGAAWAWTARVAVDAFLLFAASKLLAQAFTMLLPGAILIILAQVGVYFFGDSYLFRFISCVVLLLLSFTWAWLACPDLIRTLSNRIMPSLSTSRSRG